MIEKGIPSSQLNDAGAKPIGLNVPPPPSVQGASVPVVSPQLPSIDDQGPEIEVNHVIDLLEKVILAKDNADARKVQEIRKRIELFRQKWQQNELNDKVKHGMHKLVCHLDSKEYDEAEKLQRSLNVDYPNLCTPWMIAIRQLILVLKQ